MRKKSICRLRIIPYIFFIIPLFIFGEADAAVVYAQESDPSAMMDALQESAEQTEELETEQLLEDILFEDREESEEINIALEESDSVENGDFLIDTDPNGRPMIVGLSEAGKINASLVIPDGTAVIGSKAFKDCTNIANITIPEGLDQIWDNAFEGCTGLTEIVIPKSVYKFGKSVFMGCSSLSKVTIYSDILTVDNNTTYPQDFSLSTQNFAGCAVKELIMPNLQEIPAYLFQHADFDGIDLVIPERIESIGDYAFYKAKGINSITIQGASLKQIGKGAFVDLTLIEAIQLPETLETLGDESFSGMTNIKEIVLPKSVRILGKSVFNGCSALSKVTINSDILTVENALYYPLDELLGTHVFKGCVIKELSMPNLQEIPAHLFQYASFDGIELEIPENIKAIGEYAFYRAKGINDITIQGASLKQIGKGAFIDLTLIEEVQLPESVEELGDEAFSGMIKIEKIELPKSVKKIGKDVFKGCSKLAKVIINSTELTVDDDTYYPLDEGLFGIHNFMGCTIKELEMPNLQEIPAHLFQYADFDGIDIIIPENIKAIGDYAFYRAKGINSITMPEGNLKRIGKGAFFDLTSIEAIQLPETVEELGDEAFSGMVNIREIELPRSVVKLGKSVFSGCSRLSKVIINSEELTIDNDVYSPYHNNWGTHNFAGCSIKELEMPNLKEIPKCMFQYAVFDDIDLVIPANVCTINEHAFYGATGIKSIVLYSAVATIGDKAFGAVNDLRDIIIGKNVGCNSLGVNVFLGTKDYILDTTVNTNNERFREYDWSADKRNVTFENFPANIEDDTLDKSATILKVNGKWQFSIDAAKYPGKVAWKTSDKKVATVSPKGKVTAKGGGTVTISAYVYNIVIAEFKVWVYQFKKLVFGNGKTIFKETYTSEDEIFDEKDLITVSLIVEQKNAWATAGALMKNLQLKEPTAKSSKAKVAEVKSVTLKGDTITLTVQPKKKGTAKIKVKFGGKTATYSLKIK